MKPIPDFTLNHLLEPLTIQQFTENIWDQRHFVLTRNNFDYYKALFSFADVDRLLALIHNNTTESLTIIPKDKIGREIRTRANQVTLHELYRRFTAGDTIRISGVELSWPPLIPLVRSIAQTLNANVDVNAYMTPADSQGFPTHVDYEDVFILQVDGSKEWSIYEADYPWPIEGLTYVSSQGGFSHTRRDENSLRLAKRVVLEAGDFLYIPRGYPHHAVTSGRPSLHLTIGIHPVYWLDLARAALEISCEAEPELRRALPPQFKDPQTWRATTEKLKVVLQEALQKASPEGAIEAVAARATILADLPPDGHFSSLASVGDLTLTSILERRQDLDFLVTSDKKHVTIRFGREQIRGPVSICPAVEYIRENLAFRVADIPGPLGDDSKIMLAQRLIREGLLRIVAL